MNVIEKLITPAAISLLKECIRIFFDNAGVSYEFKKCGFLYKKINLIRVDTNIQGIDITRTETSMGIFNSIEEAKFYLKLLE